MRSVFKSFIVNNISLPYDASFEEAFSVTLRIFRKEGVVLSNPELSIFRKSIDARKKNDIKIVYSVLVSAEFDAAYVPRDKAKISPLVEEKPTVTFGSEKAAPPVVVGAGPCGMFAALMLAENGYSPVLFERGGSVKERKAAVSKFLETRVLDTATNIQFGAGGAGTFSDGKLVTRINDPFTTYVLKTLVKYGAPSEILYLAKPHVGTDVLSVVVDNILNDIERLGGKVLYNTSVTGFKGEGKITSVITDKGELECGGVILAVGHSARDTYSMLMERQVELCAKDFSVGLRIEHPTEVIDRGMYGDCAGHKNLGHGEYTLSYNTKIRGVYTFCMCPGGEVVAATSEEGGVVVNGMSNYRRDGENSNCAVCCSVFKNDFDGTVNGAIEFQRNIERAAFVVGGKDYSAPIITVGDFLKGECKTSPDKVIPTYMGGKGVRLAPADSYLPGFVCDGIRGAILDFDRKIKGFAMSEAVLTGPETRTSAPVRILRDNSTRVSSAFSNLYPAGEGAGYAGGITSAAIDGLRCAIAYMARYCPNMHG